MQVSKQWYEHVRMFVFHHEPHPEELLWMAIEANAMGLVKLLINRHDVCQGRILNTAVKSNNFNMVRKLVGECGVSVKAVIPEVARNDKYMNEWTVLHTACFYGCDETFILLVDEFDALEDKDERYITRLSHLALAYVNVAIWFELVNRFGAVF